MDGKSLKPVWLFLAGSLLGVCMTVGVFYSRGPISRRIGSVSAGNRDDVRVVAPLRPNEAAMGAASAPVVMIEYSDFQCPYCALFRAETFPRIKSRYIDSGQLRYIHRNLPLPGHRQAMAAAEAAACAGDQGLFWELSELMFSRASCLDCQGVMELSKAIPLNRRQFETCVSSNLHRPDIDRDMAGARDMNFRGTPSFVIGRAAPAGVEGVAIQGAVGFDEVAAKIDRTANEAAAARR